LDTCGTILVLVLATQELIQQLIRMFVWFVIYFALLVQGLLHFVQHVL
jgi:hypothetical protein